MDSKIRFLVNITTFFINDDLVPSSASLIVSGQSKLPPANQWWPIVVSIFNDISVNHWTEITSWSDLEKRLSYWSEHIYPAGSNWTSSINEAVIKSPPKSYYLSSPNLNHELLSSYINLPKFDTILNIHNTSLNAYESLPPPLTCLTARYLQPVDLVEDECNTFRVEATYAYVTHINFIESQNSHRNSTEFDTTLITMFTLDRFNNFERLVAAWGNGPVMVILYADSDESEKVGNNNSNTCSFTQICMLQRNIYIYISI